MVCPMRFALVGISAFVAVVALAVAQCSRTTEKGGLERRSSNTAALAPLTTSSLTTWALTAKVDGRNWRRALLDMFTGRYLWRVGCELYDSCARPAEGCTRPLHTAAVKAA